MFNAILPLERNWGRWLLIFVFALCWTAVYADDFYVIPTGKKATGNATADHVLKGKTFSNATGKGLTGRRPPAPIPLTGPGPGKHGVAWPDPRFAEGTYVVTDNLTGIMWQKYRSSKKYDQSDALGYCRTLVIWEPAAGGFWIRYDDWFLPNTNELASLISLTEQNPALPKGHPFEGMDELDYWSSTGYSWGGMGAYFEVDFEYGEIMGLAYWSELSVRCARGQNW